MRPVGVSRKQYRDMVEVCKLFVGKTTLVYVEGEAVLSHSFSAHEEGYTAKSVVVSINDEGSYFVSTTTKCKDCDGPSSAYGDYVVRRFTGKRKRVYNDRNWKTGAPTGKFWMKPKWKVISQVESQRDVYAERMGY